MQQTHLRLAPTRTLYPWELSDETRRIGKAGLARARAILSAHQTEPAQMTLELSFSTGTGQESAPSAATPPHRAKLAA